MQQLNRSMTERERKEHALASSVVDILSAAYPGFAWTACCDSVNGIVKIAEPSFMDTTVPYVLHLHHCLSSEKVFRKELMRVGGEMLERFFLPREKLSPTMAQSKIAQLRKTVRGHAVFDAHGISNYVGKQ